MKLEIYQHSDALPIHWNQVVASESILLSKEYFSSLNQSQPTNVKAYYVGFFQDETLIGGAMCQHIIFSEHNSFQNTKIWCSLKNFLTKKYAKDILIVGNNMLTGQHAFHFTKGILTEKQLVIALNQAAEKLNKTVGKPSMLVYKDFTTKQIPIFKEKIFKKFYQFSVQPNMVLKIASHWNSFDDYIQDFSTKYRSRAKTARKKLDSISCVELSETALESLQDQMHILYENVAERASFNTFFLPKNHFFSLKKYLKEDFIVLGYYDKQELVGFCTLISNKNGLLDTYFLGYNSQIQKDKQLYLNMLLDMVEYGITHSYRKIIFGRTALEIKSTIGAEPQEIFGMIRHKNAIINHYMERIFPILEPKHDWIQRKPFK